jgi:phage tail-like protein
MSAQGSADIHIDVSLGLPGAAGAARPAAAGAAPASVLPKKAAGPSGPSSRGTSKSGAARTPDPVGELRFTVALGKVGPGTGREVGWFMECSGLVVEWDVFTYEEGGLNDYAHKFRGRAKYQNLVLKRGVTYEETLLGWFMQCKDHAERRDISVQLVGPDGQPVRTWKFLAAFPVKWTGPTLNAGSNNPATESLEIAHHGFQEGS